MIFKPKMARAIVRGAKTQTRRPVKWIAADRDLPIVQRKGGGHRQPKLYVDEHGLDAAGKHHPLKVQEPCRYKPEHDYALQTGRGKEAEPGIRLYVTAVRQERLGEISFEDARAEGFRTRQEFFDYWTELYGELEPDTLVWVISFRPHHTSRFLTDNLDPRKGPLDIVPTPPSTGGMKDQPEVVPLSFENLMANDARRNRADELADLLSAMENVEQALSERIKMAPEVNGELRRARKQIQRARAKLKGQIASLERAA